MPFKANADRRHHIPRQRRQQAKSWELRTASSHAQLLRDQGRVSEAYELLAPIHGWFIEGFGTMTRWWQADVVTPA